MTRIPNLAAQPTAQEALFSLVKQWPHCDVLFDREFDDPFATLELAQALAIKSPTGSSRRDQAVPVNPKAAALSQERCLRLVRCSQQDMPLLDTTLHQDIACSAPEHVLLTAGGSALRIEPGKITITTMRRAVFQAQQRVITGPVPAQGAVELPQGALPRCAFKSKSASATGGAKVSI